MDETNEKICEIAWSEYDRTESWMETPYYREIAIEATLDCEREFSTYYTSYQAFCLETRLYPAVRELLGRCYEIQFVTKRKPEEKRMQLCVQLSKEGIAVPIPLDIKQTLEEVIQSITSQYPAHCLLFDTTFPLLKETKKTISVAWIQSIWPYLYDALVRLHNLSNFEPLYDHGSLYVKWPARAKEMIRPEDEAQIEWNHPSFEERHYTALNAIVSFFQKEYEHGLLLCTASFAQEWHLEERTDLLQFLSDDLRTQLAQTSPTMSLYSPVWHIDTRLNIAATELLMNQWIGKYELLLYPFDPFVDNRVQKHWVALALHSILAAEIYILDNSVQVEVHSYPELREIIENVWLARQKAYGSVSVQKIMDAGKIEIYEQHLTDQLEGDLMSITYYRAIDGVLYLSILTHTPMEEKIREILRISRLKM